MSNFLSRNAFLHALVCLSLTVFCLYSVQELAVENVAASIRRERTSPPILSSFYIKDKSSSIHEFEELETNPVHVDEDKSNKKDRKVWITMGLCWGENAQVHGKQNFPYLEAAPRSITLWHKFTEGRVILQLVYKDNITKEMEAYTQRLEKLGAVVLLKKADELPCVLTAQLIRLVVFTQDFVDEDDIIVTSDVDAFVTGPDIFIPLKIRKKKIWLWRYELSYNTGYTFMLNFIGAYSHVWRSLLKYNGSLSQMVKYYGTLMNFKDDSSWDVDQHIVTRSILESGLCSLPASSTLWKEVGLTPASGKDPGCWHGSGIWEDCNNKLWTRNAMIRFQGKGCKWWHFYPDETTRELEQRFKEIVRSPGDNGLLSTLIRKAGDVKESFVKKYMTVEHIPRPDPAGELEIWSDHRTKT